MSSMSNSKSGSQKSKEDASLKDVDPTSGNRLLVPVMSNISSETVAAMECLTPSSEMEATREHDHESRASRPITTSSAAKCDNILKLPSEILQKIIDESVGKWDIFMWLPGRGYRPRPGWRRLFARDSRPAVLSLRNRRLHPIVSKAVESKFSGVLVIRGGDFSSSLDYPNYVVNRLRDVVRIEYRSSGFRDFLPPDFRWWTNLREVVMFDRQFHLYYNVCESNHNSILNGEFDEAVTEYIMRRRHLGNVGIHGDNSHGFWHQFRHDLRIPADNVEFLEQQYYIQKRKYRVTAVIEIPGHQLNKNKWDKSNVCVHSKLNSFDSTPFKWTVVSAGPHEIDLYPPWVSGYYCRQQKLADIRREKERGMHKKVLRSRITNDSSPWFQLEDTFLTFSE